MANKCQNVRMAHKQHLIRFQNILNIIIQNYFLFNIFLQKFRLMLYLLLLLQYDNLFIFIIYTNQNFYFFHIN